MSKYFFIGGLLVSFCLSCAENKQNNNGTQQSNSLSQQEKEDGWELLFNGVSSENWRGYNSESFPEVGWSVQDGTLAFEPVDRDGAEGSQNIITTEKYENFHLKLDWKIEEGSNSGIFYGVLEQDDIDIFWSGIEYQIIDNNYFFPDANPETETRMSGALYDLVPAVPQNARPLGEWNSAEIIIDGDKVTHRQNGENVVELVRWTPEWFEMIRNSKFASHNEFGNVRRGHVGIQDHGGPVMIRNIKIKVLD